MKNKSPTVKIANYNLAYSIDADLYVVTIEISSQKFKKVTELIGVHISIGVINVKYTTTFGLLPIKMD